MKQLEALVLHIAEPKGNVQKGKFGRSPNLLKALRVMMKERQKQQMEHILGIREKKTARAIKPTKFPRARRGLILHTLLPPGTQIRASYKGKEVLATIQSDGTIHLNGKTYKTPSAAGLAVIDSGAVNGWRFWKYQKDGKWVPLGELL